MGVVASRAVFFFVARGCWPAASPHCPVCWDQHVPACDSLVGPVRLLLMLATATAAAAALSWLQVSCEEFMQYLMQFKVEEGDGDAGDHH